MTVDFECLPVLTMACRRRDVKPWVTVSEVPTVGWDGGSPSPQLKRPRRQSTLNRGRRVFSTRGINKREWDFLCYLVVSLFHVGGRRYSPKWLCQVPHLFFQPTKSLFIPRCNLSERTLEFCTKQ